MFRGFLMLCLSILPGATLAAAPLEVVATTASLGMLAREVGGDAVRVTVLAPPDRDIHSLQARPSMIRDLRGADLLLAVGAELESAWLPAALRSAANPRLLPGREGYFEAAAQVELRDRGTPADRAQGDVHPSGNPHLHMDPLLLAEVAEALAETLARLAPAGTEAYRKRAAGFSREAAERVRVWQAQAGEAPGAVFYHKSVDYLAQRLNVPILGYVEPVPGVPPTPGHLRALVEDLRGRRGVILFHDYHPRRGPDFLAQAMGWRAEPLPSEPPASADAADYFAFIGAWVQALADPGP